MHEYFTREIVSEWSPKTQALARIADAHFDLFNRTEAETKKGKRKAMLKTLATLRNSFEYLRNQ